MILTVCAYKLEPLHDALCNIRDGDKNHDLLLFLPLCCPPNLIERFTFFSWLKLFWKAKKIKNSSHFAFWVELLDSGTASCPASFKKKVVNIRCPPVPAPVRCTDIFKRKQFPCLVWSFLFNLNYIAALYGPNVLCQKLISQQGLLSKNSDVPSYHPRSVALC